MLSRKRLARLSDLPKQAAKNQLALINGLNIPVHAAIEKIEYMEQQMLAMDQVEVPVNHYFGKDVYVREIFFKAGTIATGAVQKFNHVSIMLSGHMTLWTPEHGVHDVYGPSITEVKHGMKRAGYAHTDVHWACAYSLPNNERFCEDEILDFLTFKKYGEYLEFIETPVLLGEY